MPPRRPLHAAVAASVLAFSAAGCASTPSASAPTAKPAKTAATVPHTTATNLPPSTSIESELQNARGLRAQGHLQEALRALAQLVLVAPDDARVVSEYGKVLVQLGRSDDAIA